jgi:hypothetical protein
LPELLFTCALFRPLHQEITMQFTRTLVALAVAACAAPVFAEPVASRIAISSGASAVFGNYRTALDALCTAAGGTPTRFNDTGNLTTIVCANGTVTGGVGGSYDTKTNLDFINFAGTAFAEVRINVSKGSFSAACVIQPGGWPASGACGAADLYRDPLSLTTVAAPTGSIVVGGVLDVEANAWPTTVLTGLVVPTSVGLNVAQSFGVAASNELYTKMFDAQKSTGTPTVLKPIPSTCSVGDTGNPTCVPTVSKAQMASILGGNEFGSAYSNGLGFLTGDAADNGVALRYARRADTSGTQASQQIYFLGLPCMKNPLPIVAGGQTLGAIQVQNHGGTSDVRADLNQPGYAIGIMSGENNQTGQAWRWLRVGGAAMAENATPGSSGITNSASVKNGSYDFFFEATYASSGQPGADAFWTAVSGSLNTLPAPVGLLNAAELAASTAFAKGGNSCQLATGN